MEIASASNAVGSSLNSVDGTSLTIISGVAVFVLGQLFVELILRPLQQYRKLKSKIAYSLVYYANIYSNPVRLLNDAFDKEAYCEAGKELRILAAQVKGFAEEKWIFNYPPREALAKVSSNLIGLSNNLIVNYPDKAADQNQRRVDEIRKLIKLYEIKEK